MKIKTLESAVMGVNPGRTFQNQLIIVSNFTRSEFAGILGVHASTVSYWYTRGVTKNHAKHAAELLAVNVKTILSRAKKGRPVGTTRKSIPTTVLKNPIRVAPVISKMTPIRGHYYSGIDNLYAKFQARTDYDTLIDNRQAKKDSEPRTVNIDLLALIANQRLSAHQESALYSLALALLGEKA